MKKILFTLLSIFLLGAMGMSAETTYNHSFKTATFTDIKQTQTLNGINWTLDGVAAKGTPKVLQDGASLKIGNSNNSYFGTISLSTTDIPGTISSITITTKGNSKIQGNLSVTVNGNIFGEPVAMTSTMTAHTFSGSGSGEIKILWGDDKTKLNKPVYLESISVTYTNEGGVTPPPTSKVATPVISPNGGEITADQEITISCTDADAIYYTTDGTTPSKEKAEQKYNGAFKLTQSATVKAIGVKAGLADSEIASATFTLPIVHANIKAFLEAHNGETGNSKIEETIAGDLTAVYYNSSQKYLYIQDNTGSLLVYNSGNVNIPADIKNGDILNPIKGTYSYYKGQIQLKPIAEITITRTGTPVEPKIITSEEVTAENSSCYVRINNVSFDGTNLNSGNTVIKHYNRFGITMGSTGDVIGFINVFNTPQLLPTEFIENTKETVATPVITPNGKTFNIGETILVTISCETAEATIEYSTDGTIYNPYPENGIDITESCTIYARATKDGMNPSLVAEAKFVAVNPNILNATFNFSKAETLVPTPEFGTGTNIDVNGKSFENNNLKITIYKGSGTNTPLLYKDELRMYKENEIKIETGLEGPNPFTITKISLNAKNSNMNEEIFFGDSTTGETLINDEWISEPNENAEVIRIKHNGNRRDFYSITIYYDKTTSIEDSEISAASVFGTEGGVEISGVEGYVVVYNVYGQQVANEYVNGNATIATPSGLMIVKAGETVTKVLVK